jgi:dolichyl-diphosphooligosaccharide--protein glycosyltransferase
VAKEKVPSEPRSRNLHVLIVFALIILFVVAYSVDARLSQLDGWKQDPERHFFTGDRPLLTSADGYYWVRMAEEYRDATLHREPRDRLRTFPDGADWPRPVPLLSLLLDKASKLLGVDLYTAGVYLIPLLASLFIVPLAIYLFRVGLPAAGILGGLVATLSHEYLSRTSIGGVDTDALNLFFPLTASLFILYGSEAKTASRTYLFSALAGFTMLLFYWWYYHAGFTWAYLALLLIGLLIQRAGWRTIIISSGLFVLASNPLYFVKGFQGLSQFMANTVSMATRDPLVDSVRLPAILPTVTEFQREGFLETLALVLDPPLLTLVGLALFGIAAVTRWRKLLYLLPILALGLLAFHSGRRFAIFLAPFAGAGYGFLVTLVVERLPGRFKIKNASRELVTYAAALLVFAVLYGATAAGYQPRPWLSSRTMSTIVELRDRLPANGVVTAWWDFGYPLGALGRFATYHDGSSHGLVSYLIARALSSERPEELYGTLAYINRTGQKSLHELLGTSPDPTEILRDAVRDPGPVERDDIHVLFLDTMIPKYAAIHYLGTWDLDRAVGSADGYQKLECTEWAAGKIRCGELSIDTITGYVNDGLTVEKIVYVRNGHRAEESVLQSGSGVYLQVLASERGVSDLFLISERVFNSNFNRMYMLGEHDPDRFELVHDDFPTARVFRLKRDSGP